MKRFFSDYQDSLGTFVDAGVDWSRKHLTLYLLCRLLWNPRFDTEAAFGEYCQLMYGQASAPMRKLFDTLTDRWEQSRWSHPLPPYHRISLKNVHVETYPPEVVRELKSLYETALGCVEADSLEAERIRFFGIALKAFFEESERFHQSRERRTLRVARAGSALKIDGRLDEPCWRKAAEAELMVGFDATAPSPPIKTTVRGLWHEGGVVLAFRLDEPDLKGLRAAKTGRGEHVFMDDCIEIFLDPKGEFGDYFQIVVNANGAIFDASSVSDPYSAWNCAGAEVGIRRGQDHWAIEISLPFRDLGVKGGQAGRFWYGNFTRSRWRKSFELYRFSTVDVPPAKTSNLNMLHFGKIVFVE